MIKFYYYKILFYLTLKKYLKYAFFVWLIKLLLSTELYSELVKKKSMSSFLYYQIL